MRGVKKLVNKDFLFSDSRPICSNNYCPSRASYFAWDKLDKKLNLWFTIALCEECYKEVQKKKKELEKK